jgi:hypothetical protein
MGKAAGPAEGGRARPRVYAMGFPRVYPLYVARKP